MEQTYTEAIDSFTGSRSRKHRRFAVQIPVDCSTRGMFMSNHVSNLSRGGLFLPTSEPIPIDTEVDLTFVLPDDHEVIEARGRVVWSYDIRKGSMRVVPGAGIKFIGMSADNQSRLEKYLERLAGTETEA
jgi:uncharacterized protein (TIGR02266 family)